MLSGSGPVLVLAPHPDDEVLGVGGSMARLADEGREVYVAIVTRGDRSMFSDEFVEQGRREALEAHEILGVRKTVFMEGFAAALLDTVPQSSLNAAVLGMVDQIDPELLFIPFPGDLHVDHRRVAEAALVAARPNRRHGVRAILCYEALSETNWNAPGILPGFFPNTYVDISSYLRDKLEAMRHYQSQLMSFPHERSLKALEALARVRGATAGLAAAEAFVLARTVVPS
jgi:LmbE family N-acetylglucosaminyl deacetylase